MKTQIKLFERKCFSKDYGSNNSLVPINIQTKESIEDFEARINKFLTEHPGDVRFIDNDHIYICYGEEELR